MEKGGNVKEVRILNIFFGSHLFQQTENGIKNKDLWEMKNKKKSQIRLVGFFFQVLGLKNEVMVCVPGGGTFLETFGFGAETATFESDFCFNGAVGCC